jgi:hypothetical protein
MSGVGEAHHVLLVCGLTGWVNHRRRPDAGGATGKDRKAPARHTQVSLRGLLNTWQCR